jgi:hypothetical protein
VIRPEVLEAIDQLETSLGDVARWEQLLSGKPDLGEQPLATDPVAAPAPAPAPASSRSSWGRQAKPAAAAAAVAPIALVDPEDPTAPARFDLTFDSSGPGLKVDLPPRPDGPPPVDRDGNPTDFAEEGSLLWQARTIDPPTGQQPTVVDETVQQRRRNGRILSWAGVLVLVLGAALWLVPDRSGDPELPAIESEETTTTTTRRVFAPPVSQVTVPTTLPTTVPTVTPTTKKASTTATTKKPTAVTTPPATTPTTQAGPGFNPGTTPPIDPSRPTTTVPTTTTTTTTTAPPVTIPPIGE